MQNRYPDTPSLKTAVPGTANQLCLVEGSVPAGSFCTPGAHTDRCPPPSINVKYISSGVTSHGSPSDADDRIIFVAARSPRLTQGIAHRTRPIPPSPNHVTFLSHPANQIIIYPAVPHANIARGTLFFYQMLERKD